MKKKENPPQDTLAMLRQAWQAHEEHVRQLPGLDEEQLERLYDDYRRRSHPSTPLAEKTLAIGWTQVLSALACLGTAVWGGVVVGQVGDDQPLRVMVTALVALSLLLALHCFHPQSSPLFQRYREEIASIGRPPAATFGFRRVLPVCAMLLVTFSLASLLTIGDGYHIATMGDCRLAAINDIDQLIPQMS